MSSFKKSTTTQRGLGLPSESAAVPAGGRASSSGDRTDLSVGDQAASSSNATGRKEPTSRSERPKMDLLKPGVRPRTDSMSSYASAGSGASILTALSRESNWEVEQYQEAFTESWKLNDDAKELYNELKKELQKMTSACEKQPNISKVVKDGIKNINTLVDVYQKTVEKCWIANNECSLRLADYRDGHNARRLEKKSKIETLKLAAGANTLEKKRSRDPDSSPDKEKKKKKNRKKKEEKKAPKKAIPSIMVDKAKMPKQAAKKKVLIKVAEGRTFAEVLRKVKTDFRPENCNAIVQGVHKTIKGDILLCLKGSSDRDKAAANLNEIVSGVGRVESESKRKVTLEIRDLDALAEVKEVEDAVEKTLGFAFQKREVVMLRPNTRQQRLALVSLTEEEATKLEQLGHLKVGFISCRIRRRTEVRRCFKCLGYGHTAGGCRSEDRSKLCFRCGSSNHRKKECKNEPLCFLCKEDNKHMAGSGACRTFRQALEQARK